MCLESWIGVLERSLLGVCSNRRGTKQLGLGFVSNLCNSSESLYSLCGSIKNKKNKMSRSIK